MKKAIIALILFFVLCVPALAADDADEWTGQFGVNAGVYFFNNDALDNNAFFGGVEYRGEQYSIGLDYVAADAVAVGEDPGGTEQLMFAYIDYIYYFNADDYDTESPTYIGGGYTHRFQGDAVDDKGGFNIVLGIDWDQNWNFEAKYIRFDSDDSVWGISAGYFFE